MRFSKLAQEIQTSPIITLAAEINEKIARGETFYNLTIGDFNPQIFPIPVELRDGIIEAYHEGHTNYPGAKGVPELRDAASNFLKHAGDLEYSPEEVLVSSGSRPLIYAAYRTVTNPGDKVIFPVPSWNNDHYSHLNALNAVVLETSADKYFMPDASVIEPHLKDAYLLALCSPLNPTGTVFTPEGLTELCDMVLAENRSRGKSRRPIYIIFDQIYWLLTFGGTKHYNPVNLRPEMRDYVISIDGLSKSFAGTGIRCGFSFAPLDITAKMRSVVAHMGAWAPKAEQVAAGRYLADLDLTDRNLDKMRGEVRDRLEGFYKGFSRLKEKGYRVDAIEPQAAIYLTVQLELAGSVTEDGTVLETNHQVHRYILDEAKVGLVPFGYFGASEDSTWYRLSVGTCRLEEVELIMTNLENALEKLKGSTNE